MQRLIVSILFFVVAPLTLFAQERIALVIGNSDYQSIGILQNAGNDAALISASLSAVGFEVTTHMDLDEDSMGAAIDTFSIRAASAEIAAFYYAGHGVQVGGKNYLMPVDTSLTTQAAITRDGLALDNITDALASAPISLVFLDACRNNPLVEDMISRAPSDSRNVAVSRGLAVMQPPGDMLLAFATLPNSTATDGLGSNSPFATALARHISTPNIEISVMMKRVTADVLNATSGVQRPQQISQMQKEFYFLGGGSAPVPDPVTAARNLLTVYPAQLGVGEEVSVFADIDTSCTPSFFNLTDTQKLQPVPLAYFEQTPLAGGQVRYEISPGSRFGLIVQEDDQKSINNFGYFCTPNNLTDVEHKRALLRKIVAEIESGREDGTVVLSGFGDVSYQARPYIIQ